jgi:hypothetical protein
MLGVSRLREEGTFVIGMSQANGAEPWRQQMDLELSLHVGQAARAQALADLAVNERVAQDTDHVELPLGEIVARMRHVLEAHLQAAVLHQPKQPLTIEQNAITSFKSRTTLVPCYANTIGPGLFLQADYAIGGADGALGRGMMWQGMSLWTTLRYGPSIWVPSSVVIVLAVMAGAGVYALVRPERGLPDLLAGTHLVPK